jgi:DNA repair protein RadC
LSKRSGKLVYSKPVFDSGFSVGSLTVVQFVADFVHLRMRTKTLPFNQLEFVFKPKPKRRRRIKPTKHFKIISLSEASPLQKEWQCETPEAAVEYWRTHISTAPWFPKDQECTVVILLNARFRILGHHLISIGILDQALVHPRETFRAAIIAAAYSIVLAHNHPSGDPTPSQADITATSELVRAGECIRIRLADHVIIGNPGFSSLRKLGFIQ